MKNPNLTITLPTGFLSGKPLAKLQSFNEKVAEHDKDCATLELDATGDAIDVMTAEVSELEQWQHIIRRRRLKLARLGLSLSEERETLLTELHDDCLAGVEKAEGRHESAIDATVKKLELAGIGPRPNASVQAATIQMRHRALESAPVQEARAAMENAKVAREMAYRAADSQDALREHYRDEIQLIISLYAVL